MVHLILRWSFFRKIIPLQDISSISSVGKENLQGIRSFGVGIPGHLVGRFRLKFDGDFHTTTLYATNLDNLVIIRTSDNKTYGITPEKKEEFIHFMQFSKPSIRKTDVDTTQPIRASENNDLKISKLDYTLFLICVVLSIGTIIYFIIVYQSLPETGVPLHWGPGGVVDRFGNKSELLVLVCVFHRSRITCQHSCVYLDAKK